MIQLNERMWRRTFLFSATFLLTILVGVGCKKKDTTFGKDLIDSESILNGEQTDTFTIVTSTFLQDSLLNQTKDPALAILGNYNDPIFGKVRGSFYTQLRLAAANPNFGDINNIVIDSFVLSLKYSGYQAGLDPQTIQVFQLADTISRASNDQYYSHSEIPTTGVDLMDPNKNSITPAPETGVVIDTSLTLSDPMMRLFLDTNFARTLFEEATNGSAFSSNEAFLSYFKGLTVRSISDPSVGQGGVFYFDLIDAISKLTIYYRQFENVNGVDQYVSKQYNFLMNSACKDFNHFERDLTGTKVETVIDDPNQGQFEFYAQAFGMRAQIDFPTLLNLPKSTIIHKAELFLPVQHLIGSKYNPSSIITVARKEHPDSTTLFGVTISSLSEFTTGYTLDIRTHVQDVVAGKRENLGLILSPARFISSAERIIFNGPNTDNKLKPKLSIVYTEF